jgi:hypothetical protein
MGNAPGRRNTQESPDVDRQRGNPTVSVPTGTGINPLKRGLDARKRIEPTATGPDSSRVSGATGVPIARGDADVERRRDPCPVKL